MSVSQLDPDVWYPYYDNTTDHPWGVSHERKSEVYLTMLITGLGIEVATSFDHLKIGWLDRRICVFAAKGSQSAVLYDKTKEFPSARLMASLVLLGS